MRKPLPLVEEIEEGCGCIFCDLDLVPEWHKGVKSHKGFEPKTRTEHWVECTKKEHVE